MGKKLRHSSRARRHRSSLGSATSENRQRVIVFQSCFFFFRLLVGGVFPRRSFLVHFDPHNPTFFPTKHNSSSLSSYVATAFRRPFLQTPNLPRMDDSNLDYGAVEIVFSSHGPATHRISVSMPPTSNCQRIGFARTAEYAAASPGMKPNQIAPIITVFS